MTKKVFELANEVGMGAVDLVEKLRSIGLNVRNHMVALTAEELVRAEKELGLNKSADASDNLPKKVVRKKVAPAATSAVSTPASATSAAAGVVKKVVRKTTQVDAEIKSETAQISDSAPSTADETKIVAAEVVAEPFVQTSAIENATSETAVTEDAKRSKVVTIKKKDQVPRRKDRLEVISAPEQKVATTETRDEVGTDKKPLYREKMHTFTPVFVPTAPAEEDDEAKSVRRKAAEAAGEVFVEDSDEVDADGKSKKRLGNLAAIVNKKGVAAKSKDITMLRAEEELKFATGIVGRAIYTPAMKKKVYSGPSQRTIITEVKDSKRVINIQAGVLAKDLAQKLSMKFETFANECLKLNLLINEEDYLGVILAGKVASIFNYRIEDRAFNEDKILGSSGEEDKEKHPLRNPIITIMGHVDHGKTTLLDYIRKEKVASGEAGGITQHIGAYSVKVDNATLTFLDTPGHAAFAQMRQRGANVTDIVVLVVAADDGVMPQTKESIRFCKNADVPIIVAVNKMDKPGANPDGVKRELMEFSLTPEDWGGDTQYVHISALTGDGVDNLLSAIKVQAEVMELRETAEGPAEGIVIEAKIETGRGPVSTFIIQKGSLKKGDAVVVGETCGRARSLMDFSGKQLESAGPSTPVQILGLETVCSPGDQLYVVKNEREAKKVVDNRIAERKALELADKPKVHSLENFFDDIKTEEKKVLNLVVRTDVQGSFEAIKTALEVLGNEEVSVSVIGGGAGPITDSDVMQAHNAKGYIVGFNMRPVTTARRLSEEKGVEIKNYSIIYQLIDDITLALEGMLTPEYEEKYIGRAEVRDTFNIPKIGVIAGSAVIDGKIERGCKIRLLRNGKIVHDGSLSSLKRFKDDVKEVKNGYECGISLENFDDIKVQDIFEAYIMEEKKRKLENTQTL
jgi:translation initiation factor IF-2